MRNAALICHNIACNSGEQALEALRRGGVDLVFTDLIMPGVEAAEYGDRVVHMRDSQIVAPDEDPQWSPHHPAEHLQS